MTSEGFYVDGIHYNDWNEYLSKESDDEQHVDNNFCQDESDFSDAQPENSDHDSGSEIDVDDVCDSEEQLSGNSHYYYGKNKFKWSTNPPPSSRTRSSHIITHLPGLKGPARIHPPLSPIESWNLLFSSDIIDIIVKYTNIKIEEVKQNYESRNTFTLNVGVNEMKAFIGLLLLSGIYKSNHEDVSSLFSSDEFGRPIFRAVMSKERFLFLLSVLRFDHKPSREERKLNGDKAAAISEIWNKIIKNSQDNYVCSEFATVDEMLVAFRGKCFFRVYMRSKPQKYGIKILCLCDAKTNYLINAFIYTGKKSTPNLQKLSIPTETVLSLIDPIAHSNRNLTGDNWFSSVELIDELAKLGLSYVGTLRHNKREIPKEFLPSRTKKVGESLFGFTREKTLVSFVPKKNKCVLLVSTMHHDRKILTNMKPEMIDFYNATKGGVDVLDQKCASYATGRRSRRWPLTIFYRLVDISSVNSEVIFKAGNPNAKISRFIFIKNISQSLIQDHVRGRATLPNLRHDLRAIIYSIAGINPNQPAASVMPAGSSNKRKRCFYCQDDRKHSTICDKCSKTVCKAHSSSTRLCEHCKA